MTYEVSETRVFGDGWDCEVDADEVETAVEMAMARAQEDWAWESDDSAFVFWVRLKGQDDTAVKCEVLREWDPVFTARITEQGGDK